MRTRFILMVGYMLAALLAVSVALAPSAIARPDEGGLDGVPGTSQEVEQRQPANRVCSPGEPAAGCAYMTGAGSGQVAGYVKDQMADGNCVRATTHWANPRGQNVEHDSSKWACGNGKRVSFNHAANDSANQPTTEVEVRPAR